MPRALRERRTALGISQAHLAARVGVDQRQVRRYEAVHTQPALDVAARIAAALALGMTLDQLAGDGSPRLDLSGTWWLCRHGEPGEAGPQSLAVREVLTGAYPVRAAPVCGGGWLSELRALERALVGWYTVDGEQGQGPTGTRFLVLRPCGRRAVGRWVGKSGDGPLGGGVAALARTGEEAALLLHEQHGQDPR